MAENADLKPCLVPTTQGFSISYKQKFLYSKYNPEKTILNTVQNLSILPGTIILCCSPVLDYGIQEIYEKLPENCILFGCEPDLILNTYIKENSKMQDKFILLTTYEFYHFPEIINLNEYTFACGKTIEFSGNYKRVLRVDFSAGVQFNSDLFNLFYNMSSNAIKTFWTNRITLTHFGQRYSKNYFTNLHNLKNTIPVQEYFNKIEKPIIVCGAGQSLNNLFRDIQHSEDFFILCADTALKPLLSHHIVPDGVFVDEAQHVISKAFTGTQQFNYHLFASLCSLPQLGNSIPKERISYYTTVFTDSHFIKQNAENKAFPCTTIPFGSVGLTTVFFALKFRKDNSIPVFVYGLDFSYSAGVTHANQTLAHETRLLQNNRINQVQNYGAAFCPPASKISDKNGNQFFTTPVLSSYANIFINYFAETPNLFDSADCGIDLKLSSKKPFSLEKTYSDFSVNTYASSDVDEVHKYLSEERNALIYLKDILTGNSSLTQEEIPEEIKKIVQKREYLFIHFPDGFKFNSTQNFLNRVRVEIDFFLKYIY